MKDAARRIATERARYWQAVAAELGEPMKQPSPWLRLLNALNNAAMAIAGAAYVVHTTYPDVVRQLLASLPPLLGAALLFAFCLIVHFALRQAKKG